MGLAERIRDMIGDESGIAERKMFGGLCFMCDGNMCFGIVDSSLMVRVGPVAYGDAMAMPHAREMDFTGRPMKGVVYVDEAGLSEDEDLSTWLQRGFAFAKSLPPK